MDPRFGGGLSKEKTLKENNFRGFLVGRSTR